MVHLSRKYIFFDFSIFKILGFPQLFIQLYIKLLNIDIRFYNIALVYAIAAELKVFVSGLVYNFSCYFEYSHTYSIGITVSKSFTQGKSSKQIEDVVCKRMDKKSVSVYSHRFTADMSESKFVLTFLDEVFHSTAFTVCIDELLRFAFH